MPSSLMRRVLRPLALCAGLASTAAAAPTLIYDGSRPSAPAPSVSTPERRALIEMYLARGVDVCPDFRVLQRVQGRFTADAAQTLYLISNCYDGITSDLYRERMAGDALILNGQKPVYFQRDFADEVAVLPPLDGGRLNHLLMLIWQGPTQGYFWNDAWIGRHTAQGFKTVVTLGPTVMDRDTLRPAATSQRRVLWYNAAQPGQLRMMEYTSLQCPACRTPESPYDPRAARQTLNVLIDLKKPPQDAPWMRGP